MAISARLANLLGRLKKPVDNRRGIALIMAVSAVSLLIFIAMEVMYDSNVEFIVNNQTLNGLKSYYAAKAGLDISLLRIKIYQTAKQKLGDKAAQIPYLEQIWQFPLIWPMEIPKELSGTDQGEIKDLTKESLMDATFRTDIEDEGSKIDLNDLVSPSKTLVESTKKQLLQIFESEKRDNQDFNSRFSGYKFSELVNWIADWMSSKRDSFNGGDKVTRYRDYENDEFPPNRGFRTLRELRLVAGMNDEFYDLLAPRVTIYGLKGINPNSASKEVLMTLDSGITAEVADKILEHIKSPEGGPFKGGKEGIDAFWQFVTGPAGARLEQKPEDIPIVMDSMVSFRVTSTGLYAGASRRIQVIVMDLNQSAQRTSTFVKQDKEKENPGQAKNESPPPPNPNPLLGGNPVPTQGPGSKNQNEPLPKGPPRIVYWSEK